MSKGRIKGHIVSLETRKKIAETVRKRHKEGIYKHVFSNEERNKKISDSKMGHDVSEETKRKISFANSGRLASEETKRKMSESHKGNNFAKGMKPNQTSFKKGLIPWNKELKGYMSGEKNYNYHRVFSEEEKQKMRLISLGRTSNKKGKTAEEYFGIERAKEIKQKIKDSLKTMDRTGINAAHWKGGLTKKNKLIRSSVKFQEWRAKVLKRDNYTCQGCGSTNGKKHIHHILPLAKYKIFSLYSNNGMILCKLCHQKIHRNMKMNSVSTTGTIIYSA